MYEWDYFYKILPATDPLLLELRDAEGERTHEVVPAGQIPVPDLHRQTSVFIRLAQVTAAEHKPGSM